MEKPANTENFYEQLILKNGIAVTLASVPNSEKSSAALFLKAGAAEDSLPGLAHFTEHAVFLGSHTYPTENAFKMLLSKNGGSSNGGTAMEYTSFQFQVNYNEFSNALEIWSHFFIDPLFTENAISREIMAVDAEDSKNRILDNRRLLQVMKDLLVEETSYRKFSTGNVKTLAGGDAEANGPALAATMKQFYNQHYNPATTPFTLALVGPQSLDELRRLAEEKFAGIQSESAVNEKVVCEGIYPGGVFPFQEGVAGSTLRVKPIKDVRDLSIIIPLPSTRHLHLASPTRLLAVCLSHKGEGSLFAHLQDKGWATAVSGGERTEFRNFVLFEMSVALTEEGLKHYQDVEAAVYAYLGVIEHATDVELLRIWDEQRQISAIDFSHQEKSTAYELAPYIARQMLEVPLHRVLSSGWLLGDLDLSNFRSEFLARLTPGRALTVLRSKTFASLPDDGPAATAKHDAGEGCDAVLGEMRVEQWYQTPYALAREEPAVLQRWDASRARTSTETVALPLTVPAHNEFICHELLLARHDGQLIKGKLKSDPPVSVSLPVSSSSRVRAFRSFDQAFAQPRFVVHTLLTSVGHASAGLTYHPVLSLCSSVFAQTEARRFYMSSVAGLSHSVSVGSRGLGLSVSGYSPRLLGLLEAVAQRFGDLDYWRSVDPRTVEILKERMLRGLRSWTKERPDTVADTMLTYLLQEEATLPTERIALAEAIDKPMVVKAMESVLQRARVTVLVHGERGDEKTAQLALSLVEKHLGRDMAWEEVQRHQEEHGWGERDRVLRARLLPSGHSTVLLDSFNPEDSNSAIIVHFQTELRSPATSALSLLLANLLREPAFNELRTKRQLGYIVNTAVSGHGAQDFSMRGVAFRVLSQRFGPAEMEAALDDFLQGQRAAFQNLSQDDVDTRTTSVINSLLDPPTSYTEEAGGFWSAIVEDQPFDWVEQVVAELKLLTAERLRHAFFSYFLGEGDDGMGRRSVAVHIESLTHKQTRLESSSATAVNKQTVSTSSLADLTVFRDSLNFVQVRS